MTFYCINCEGHYDEGQRVGDDYGSIFFPEGVKVCGGCSLKTTCPKKFSEFETQATRQEKEAMTNLVFLQNGVFESRIINDGQHDQNLDYGENAPGIVDDNMKYHVALENYKKMEINFQEIDSWAKVLYMAAWRNSPRYVGERVSWYSVSNNKVIQATIVEKDNKTYILEAIREENYQVKDKNGVLCAGGLKKLSEKSIYPPKTYGKNVFKKQKVCHGCRKPHLKGHTIRGLDDEKNWFCSKCDIMTFGDLPTHEVHDYHEHYGKGMTKIPGHLRKKFWNHNLAVMERECWPCTHNTKWPYPIPEKKDAEKFGMNRHEKDMLWIQDEHKLTECMSCGMKVSNGWSDIRVDENDWNCEYCWKTFHLREGSLRNNCFIAGREKSVILATDSDGNVTPKTLLDENYWKLPGPLTRMKFIYKGGEISLEDIQFEGTELDENKDQHLKPTSGKKKKKKKNTKMNLQDFHKLA